MARTTVTLCIAGLLAVCLSGFSLPDGGPLSNRDLDKLVGGTGLSWCDPCLNCDCTPSPTCYVEDVPDCDGPGECNFRKTEMYSGCPSECSSTMGNQYCTPEASAVDVLCKTETDCTCKESSPDNWYCDKDLDSAEAYNVPGLSVDSFNCGYTAGAEDATDTSCN